MPVRCSSTKSAGSEVKKLIPYPELFDWWTATISAGSIFLVLVSIYLYVDSNKRREKNNKEKASFSKLVYKFVFVWVLLGLLSLYVVSIRMGTSLLFAGGNIIVEVILIIYGFKNKSDATQDNG
jgi:amino acid transporter